MTKQEQLEVVATSLCERACDGLPCSNAHEYLYKTEDVEIARYLSDSEYAETINSKFLAGMRETGFKGEAHFKIPEPFITGEQHENGVTLESVSRNWPKTHGFFWFHVPRKCEPPIIEFTH